MELSGHRVENDGDRLLSVNCELEAKQRKHGCYGRAAEE